MAGVRHVGEHLAALAHAADRDAVETWCEPAVLLGQNQPQRNAWCGQRRHVEVGRRGHRRDDRCDARIAVIAHLVVVEPELDDPCRHPLLEAVERSAGEVRDEADTGRKIVGDVSGTVMREAGRRPATSGQRQRGVTARRHAVDANLIELQQGRESGVAADGVDGARHLGRPQRPAVGTGIAVVTVVVGMVLGHRHHVARLHERSGQVGMHPGRAARAVRYDDEAPVAALRRRIDGQLQRHATAPDRLLWPGARVEDRDWTIVPARGQCRLAQGRRMGHRRDGTAQRERARGQSRPGTSRKPHESSPPSAAPCHRCGDDRRHPPTSLAESFEAKLSAGRFQESAMFFFRNSVGVRPVAALKARLNGPIDWKPAVRAMVSTGNSGRVRSARAALASASRRPLT